MFGRVPCNETPGETPLTIFTMANTKAIDPEKCSKPVMTSLNTCS
jgi:hypothetical protein